MKKKFLSLILGLILALSLTACSAEQREPVPQGATTEITTFSDTATLNTFGRTFYPEGRLALYNTATGFEVTFRGTSLTMSYGAGGIRTLQLAVFVDGARASTISPTNTVSSRKPMYSEQDFVICSGLKYGTHTVKVLKMTEAYANQMTISKITCDGYFLDAPAKLTKLISFYGDSLTVGCNNLLVGTESDWIAAHPGAGSPFDSLEDGTLAYPVITCNKLGAVADVHARSGIKVYNGESSLCQLNIYNKNFCGEKDFLKIGTVDYDMDSLSPDAIVINIGANDWSGSTPLAEIKAKVIELAEKLIEVHGAETPLFFAEGCGNVRAMIDIYEEIATEFTQRGYTAYHLNFTQRKEAGSHPKVADHELCGEELSSFIKSKLGW